MVKVIYIIILALFIVAFIGFGINAFHPQPREPDYPKSLEILDFKYGIYSGEIVINGEKYPGHLKTKNPIIIQNYKKDRPEMQRIFSEYQKSKDDYSKNLKNYQISVSIISLAAGIIILILSMTVIAGITVISEGVLLGGMFTLIYSIIWTFINGNPKIEFVMTTVGLAMILALGFIRRGKMEHKPAAEKENNNA